MPWRNSVRSTEIESGGIRPPLHRAPHGQNYLKLYARLAKAERTGKRVNGHANAGRANIEGSLLT